MIWNMLELGLERLHLYACADFSVAWRRCTLISCCLVVCILSIV